jgi:hypothetical protein
MAALLVAKPILADTPGGDARVASPYRKIGGLLDEQGLLVGRTLVTGCVRSRLFAAHDATATSHRLSTQGKKALTKF